MICCTQFFSRMILVKMNSFFEFHIKQDSPVAGKRVADIHWPQESVVAAIQRGRKQLIPHGDTEIKPDDLLTLIADPELKTALNDLLT